MTELQTQGSSTVSQSAEHPELSILIVGYKSKELIEAALAGLFEHTKDVEFEVLVTDCSQDGTIEMVRQKYPRCRTIPTDENLGFAAGNNFLARHALGDYLLLLNPDVLIHDNAVGQLFQFARQHPEAGAWGGQTILPDGRLDPGSRQSIPTLARLGVSAFGLERWSESGLTLQSQTPQIVDGLSGAFMMLERRVWEEVGGFDTSFFMYAEELDLCYRLRLIGRPPMMTPESRITHLAGSGAPLSPRRVQAIARAKMHFLRKHRGATYASVGGVLLWLNSAKRWLIASGTGAITGNERHKQMRTADAAVVAGLKNWWRGYPPKSQNS